jgi:RecB family endonuclease NucS
MILPTSIGWILYAECEVAYDGRASSRLQLGHYLIIFKPDKSLSIHGATLIQPRNYLAGGTTYSYTNNSIVFQCKNEQILIKIANVINLVPLNGWSNHKIEICKTEQELALKLFYNWHDYFSGSDVEIIHREFQTELGPIDIIGRSESTDYIIEVKRKTAMLKDVTQLRRYVEAMENQKRHIEGYIAAPKISKNAKEYLIRHNLNYLKIDFES